MSKTAFDKIAEGLNEALAVARGQPGGATLHTPPGMDVRAVRARTGLSHDASAPSQASPCIKSANRSTQ